MAQPFTTICFHEEIRWLRGLAATFTEPKCGFAVECSRRSGELLMEAGRARVAARARNAILLMRRIKVKWLALVFRHNAAPQSSDIVAEVLDGGSCDAEGI